MVRISGTRSPFSRGFGQTYTEELFKVRQRFATIPATYMLEDLNKVQVAGLFYEPEMVLVEGKGKDSEFLVEKILAERTRKGHKQVLSNGKDTQIHSTHGNQLATWYKMHEDMDNLVITT